MDSLAEFFSVGSASWGSGTIALFRREACGPGDNLGVLGDSRRLGHMLSDPDIESLDNGSQQSLKANGARLRERIAYAVIRPITEPDQQRAQQQRRGVAPRLGLDQIRENVRDRICRRFGIAGTDVENRNAWRRISGSFAGLAFHVGVVADASRRRHYKA